MIVSEVKVAALRLSVLKAQMLKGCMCTNKGGLCVDQILSFDKSILVLYAVEWRLLSNSIQQYFTQIVVDTQFVGEVRVSVLRVSDLEK